MGDFSFPKHLHLRRPSDFSRVYDKGRKKHSRGFVVFRLQNEHEYPRLGLSVSRKFGKAVDRNRIKRLIREAFRLHWRKWDLKGSDIVIIPKKIAGQFRLQDVVENIGQPLSRIGGGSPRWPAK